MKQGVTTQYSGSWNRVSQHNTQGHETGSHNSDNTIDRVIKQGVTTQYQGHERGLSNYVTVVYGWHAGQTVWPAVSVEELRVRESCPSSIPVSFVEIVGREWHLKGVESVEKIALTGIYRRLG